MMTPKIALTLTLTGVLAANVALAIPGFSADPPRSSIDSCVTEVDSNADLSNATSILHDIRAEERRISGHTMRIRTYVYGIDGETLIREYAASCAINGQDQIMRFRIRRKDV